MHRTKTITLKSIITLFVCIFILIVFFATIFASVSLPVLISFYINIIVLFILMVRSLEKRSFSFEFIHYFFMLYMMAFAPLMQYATTGYFLSYKATVSDIVSLNIVILIWTVSFYLGRNCKKKQIKNTTTTTHYELRISPSAEYVATVLMIIIAINRVRVSGLSVFRNASVQTNFSGNGISVLLFAIRISVVIIAVSLSIYRYKCLNKITAPLIINLVLCLIIAFPTAIPRFLAATIYGGILLMLFDKLKRNRIYAIVLIVGFLVIFPILGNFRYENTNINILTLFNQVIANFKNEYNTGNYDCYMMFFRTIDYVKETHITFGYSLLGNILFFIPRSIWPSKPVGSGSMIAGYMNFTFTNCSEPLIAESYLNFGIIGILVYAFILGRITKRIDDIYWNQPSNTFFQLTYTFYIHIFMMLLRGDFMTGFLYIFILTIVYLLFYKILGIGKRVVA